MGALAAYTESVRRLRGILARLERHGAHAEASRLAAIVRFPFLFFFFHGGPPDSCVLNYIRVCADGGIF